MHEASSDWDAGEKVVKPDQAYNSFFKGQTIPKGWESLQGGSAFTFCLFSGAVTIPISKCLPGILYSLQIPNTDKNSSLLINILTYSSI